MQIDKYTFDYVNEVLNALYDYKEFRTFVKSSAEDTWYEFSQLCRKMGDICYASGATKGVLILDDIDYVIKMPFLWETKHEWINGRLVKTDYTYHGHDYCRLEWRNYLLAEQENIAECFAETIFFGNFNGYPIYLQEKVNCDEDVVGESMDRASYADWLEQNDYEDNEENEDDYYENYYPDGDDDLAESLVYSEWNNKLASHFLNFCDSWSISDKHSGNFGYADGTLVIVDYSGYGCWDHETSNSHWDDVCNIQLEVVNAVA